MEKVEAYHLSGFRTGVSVGIEIKDWSTSLEKVKEIILILKGTVDVILSDPSLC